MYRQRYANPQYEDVTRRFIAYASQKGYSPAALAAAWVKSHPSVSAPIIGARTIEQLQDTLGCLDIVLDPEERAALSALSPEPPHATDREPLAAMKSRGW